MARHVDGREEDVAELVAARLRPQLLDLVVEVAEGSGEVGVLETDRRRAPLNLLRVEERRQGLGHVVEDPLAPLLLGLQLLPALLDRAGGRSGRVAEDVRVPPHELLVDRAGHGGEVAGPALLEEQGEEEGLEEEIAELVDELLVVGRERRVGHLVGLLDGVRDDRLGCLRAVPGAIAPQPLGQLLQVDERSCELVARHSASRLW